MMKVNPHLKPLEQALAARRPPHVMATDLRGPAIIAATLGAYPKSAIRLIERRLRPRYFVKGDMQGRERHYGIEPNLRKMIAFRRANVYDAKFWEHLHH